MADNFNPSREEKIIQSIIDGTEYTDPAPTRIEVLLLELKGVIEEGGGFTPTQVQLDAMNSGVDSTKVTQIETNENNILLKANTSDVNTATANLQAQIDQIITPTTQDAEVQNARVGADGTSYQTLKSRLDSENNKITSNLASLNESLSENQDVALTNPLPVGIVNPADLNVVGSSSRYRHDTITVSGGDRYLVTGYCFENAGNTYPAAFVYKSSDTSDVVSLLAENNTGYTNAPITIPDGYNRLVINTVYNSTDYPLKLVKRVFINVSAIDAAVDDVQSQTEALDFEVENTKRRIWNLESRDQFTFSAFDKPYFVFVHDDSNEFIVDAYNAFHSRNVPFGMATIVSQLDSKYDGHSVEEWIKLAIADGGEALTHWVGTLNDEVADAVWIEKYVKPKKVMRERGINSRGTILADNSTSQTQKGEYYSRLYYDYSDKCGRSNQYKIGRTLMSKYASLEAYMTKLDADLTTNGVYAYGFHGAGQNEVESWITSENLKSIIDYIIAAGGVVTTYGYLFDNFGSSVLAEKVKALEAAAE